jgi:hypothetical protein
MHLGQGAMDVAHVPNAERDTGRVEAVMGKRQVLGVAILKTKDRSQIAPPNLLAADREHVISQIETNPPRHPTGFGQSYELIAGSGGQIKNMQVLAGWQQPGHARAPPAVDPARQQMVKKIVPTRNPVEHSPDLLPRRRGTVGVCFPAFGSHRKSRSVGLIHIGLRHLPFRAVAGNNYLIYRLPVLGSR